MAVQSKALGTAAGVVIGAAFALCAIAVAIFPAGALGFIGWLFHVDLSSVTGKVTFGNFFGGVILLGLYVGILVALIGKLYNRITKA